MRLGDMVIVNAGGTGHNFRDSHSFFLIWPSIGCHPLSHSSSLISPSSVHLISTYRSPHHHPCVSSCRFCPLEPRLPPLKMTPETSLPTSVYVFLVGSHLPLDPRDGLVGQGSSEGSHIPGHCVGCQDGHSVKREPMKPTGFHCEFQEEGL